MKVHSNPDKSNMSTITIRLLIFLSCFLTSIQSGAQDPKEVLNRYHVSPKAGEFARQGNVPINLSVGKIGYNVPIHTLRMDDFEWPVSLIYAYSGLLLEGKPSEVGLGWTLNGGGGAVVRQVNGLPDEHVRGYWGPSSRRADIQNYTQPGTMPKQKVLDFIAGKYDSQPDKFVVSAGELNLTFFIDTVECVTCSDPNMGVKVTKTLDNTKVNFTWARIEVTDARGIVYVFEDKEITPFQTTDMQLEVGLPNAEYTSAWNLSEIVLPNGAKMEFNYSLETITSLSFSETYDRTTSPKGEMIDAKCTAGGTAWAQTMFKRELSNGSSSTIMEIRARKLMSISSPESILRIERRPDSQITGPPLITGLTIEDYLSRDIHSYDLTYAETVRPLLEKVVKDDFEKYSFQYNSVNTPFIQEQYVAGLPNVAVYQQDFWGFANGAANQSSIPERGGNRMPDFGAAAQGALTRITYPTGGSTQIVYEPNKVPRGTTNAIPKPNASFSKSKYDFPSYQWYNVSFLFHFDEDTYVDLGMSGYVKGPGTQLTVEFSRNDNSICQDEVEVAFQRKLNPGSPVSLNLCMTVGLTGDGPPGGNCGMMGSSYTACKVANSGLVLIPAGDYTATVSVYNTDKAMYTFSLQWFNPDLHGLVPSNDTEDAAGIRVKETVDCPGEDTVCLRKVYKYLNEDGSPSGQYLSKIDYSYNYQVFESKDCRNYSADPIGLPLYEEWSFMATNYSFRTLNPLEMHAGNPVYYRRVEIWDGETLTQLPNPLTGNHGKYIGPKLYLSEPKNGREVKHFEASTWGQTGSYPYRPLPDNPINGAAYKIEHFLQSGEKVKEIRLDQSTTSPSLTATDFPKGMVFGVAKVYKGYVPGDALQFDQMMLLTGYKYNKYYVDFPSKLIVWGQTETSYHPEQETHSTVNTYNSGLQLKTTTVVGSDGKSRQTKYYYPHEIPGTGYNHLTTLNKISNPVKTEHYVNDVLKRTYQTDYVLVSSPQLIVEPSSSYTTQGGITTTETTIHAYNTKGDPIEFTGRDGIRTAIQWGYPSQGLYLYPDCTAGNALANEIFFTSFEYGSGTEAGNSMDNDSHTGLKSRTGGYSHILSELTAGKDYILTWWSKSDSTWSPNTTTITNPGTAYTINLTGQVDDVRFYPKNAVVTSYTFLPGIGMTSTTDANNITSYFEYDTKGRLALVRDAEGMILKKYNYHYKGE